MRNVTGFQWVASEAWVTASLLTSPQFHPLLQGTLGFSFPGVSIPGLGDFLLKVRPSPTQGSEFINMFWEKLFGYKMDFGAGIGDGVGSKGPGLTPICTVSEDHRAVTMMRLRSGSTIMCM